MDLKIKWNEIAVIQFDEMGQYIRQHSPLSATKVQQDILSRIDGLLIFPARYNPDKYKINNDGSFRAFELHHNRIAYRFTGSEIRIIRIRHTGMSPVSY